MKSTDDDGDTKGFWNQFLKLLTRVVDAEKTTSGKVNVIGIIGIVVAGIFHLFFYGSITIIVLIFGFILSAIFSDSKIKQNARRRGRTRTRARRLKLLRL